MRKKRQITDRTLRRRAAAARAAEAAAPATMLKRADLCVEDGGRLIGLTPDGLGLVERLARSGAPLGKVGASLGVPLRMLKKHFDENGGDNLGRLAWERGRSEHEHEVIQKLLRHGRRYPASLMFYLKGSFGWRESAPLIDASVKADNRIQLTLPLPMTDKQFFEMLGIEKPLDFRTPAGKARQAEMMGLPPPGLPVIDAQFQEVASQLDDHGDRNPASRYSLNNPQR